MKRFNNIPENAQKNKHDDKKGKRKKELIGIDDPDDPLYLEKTDEEKQEKSREEKHYGGFTIPSRSLPHLEESFVQNKNKKPNVTSTNDETDRLFAEKFRSIKKNYLNPSLKKGKRKKSHHSKSSHIENETDKPSSKLSSEKKPPQSFRQFLLSNAKHLLPPEQKTLVITEPLPKIEVPIKMEEQSPAQQLPQPLPISTITISAPLTLQPIIRNYTEEEVEALKNTVVQLPKAKIRKNMTHSYRDIIYYRKQVLGTMGLAKVTREININEKETIRIIQDMVITISEKEVCARNMMNHKLYKGFADEKHRVWVFPDPESEIVCSFLTNKLWINKNKVIFVGTEQGLPTIYMLNAEDGTIYHNIKSEDIIPQRVHFEMENECLIYKLTDGRIEIKKIAAINDLDEPASIFNSRYIDLDFRMDFFLINSRYVVDIVPLPDKRNEFTILVIDIKTKEYFSFSTKSLILGAYFCNDFLICTTDSRDLILDLVNKKQIIRGKDNLNETTKQQFILKIFSPQIQINFNSSAISFFDRIHIPNRSFLLNTASQGSLAAFAYGNRSVNGDKLSISFVLVDFEKQCDVFLMKEACTLMFGSEPKEGELDADTIGLVNKNNWLTAYWLQDKKICSKSFHERDVVRLTNVYNRVVLFGNELELKLMACELYLMSAPTAPHFEIKYSSEHLLFLYRIKGQICYYTQQRMIFYIDSSLLEIAQAKFNQPHNDPLPCTDIQICHAVLKITSGRGHTLNGETSELRKKNVAADINDITIGLHRDRENKRLTAYWREFNGTICFASYPENTVADIIGNLPPQQQDNFEIHNPVLLYNIIQKFKLFYSKNLTTTNPESIKEIAIKYGCIPFAKHVNGYKKTTADCVYLYKEAGRGGRVFYVLENNKKCFMDEVNYLENKLFDSSKCKDPLLIATVRDITAKREHTTTYKEYKFLFVAEYPYSYSMKCPLQLQFKGNYLIAAAAPSVLSIWDVETKELLFNMMEDTNKTNVKNYCFEEGKLFINDGNNLIAYDYNVRHKEMNRDHENTLPIIYELKSPWGGGFFRPILPSTVKSSDSDKQEILHPPPSSKM